MILQKLLGIDLPIIQAPMAGVQGSALAVAVSNAGGLGSLPCAMLGPDAIRQELAAIRAQTTKPFNVNFFCHSQPEPSVEREAAWRAALSPYFRGIRNRFNAQLRRVRGDCPSRRVSRRAERIQARRGELSFRPACG